MKPTNSNTPAESVCSLGFCPNRSGRLATTAGAYSAQGNRETNDDLVFANSECRLYVALDGIGGHAGGAEASRIVLQELRQKIESMCASIKGKADENLRAAVSAALADATNQMLQCARQNPAYDHMGTVFALAYVVDDTLLYTHVGDSRVYLIRRGQAKQLTADETYAQLMVDIGVIPASDVQDHPMRHVVLNAVGTRSTDGPPVVSARLLLPGDAILLTTDGVSDKLSPGELANLVSEGGDADEAAGRVVEAALQAGSQDNASCVVVKIERADTHQLSERDELQGELRRVHEILHDIEDIDDDLRQDMHQLAADIRHALGSDEPKRIPPLSKRLRERALAFEVSHPHLTNAVGGIADLLASIGI